MRPHPMLSNFLRSVVACGTTLYALLSPASDLGHSASWEKIKPQIILANYVAIVGVVKDSEGQLILSESLRIKGTTKPTGTYQDIVQAGRGYLMFRFNSEVIAGTLERRTTTEFLELEGGMVVIDDELSVPISAIIELLEGGKGAGGKELTK